MKMKKIRMTKDALFQLVSQPRCHYRLSPNLVWLRGTGKLYDNSKNVLDSEKNTPSFFLINYRRCLIPTRYLTTQVTTVLQYSSELQSKLTRIKAFLSVQFVRELGKTGNNETKNNAKNKNNNNRRAKKQEHVMR